MIEKIMKVVKSGNKKRGRNITIGAVVGILLSCTVVMGADVVGLEIKEESTEIKFIGKDGNQFIPGKEEDPYINNKWNKDTMTYTNNSTIAGESADANGYGLKLTGDLSNLSFINNGSISGVGKTDGYGIYILSSSSEVNRIGSITNNGNIYSGIYNKSSGNGSSSTIVSLENTGGISHVSDYGIHNESSDSGSSTIENLINSGSIYSEQRPGIHNDSSGGNSTIENLINSGSIYSKNSVAISNDGPGVTRIGSITNSGSISGGSGNGIHSKSQSSASSTIESITNSGIISGGGSNGIYNEKTGSSSTIGNIANSGVIYGKTNAIKNANGTLSSLSNYGLLVTGGTSVIDGIVTTPKNYGLAFKDVSGTYSATDDDFANFGTISTEDEYTVINAKAKNDNKDNIEGTESLTLKNGTLSYGDSETEVISSDKKYVFNGITNTLEVSGENNKLNNSRVNAYGTAVAMGENNSILTLNNTVVNGGIKANTTTINITGDGNKFTAKGNSVINVKDEGTAITVTGNDNAVVLEGNAIVNGEMKSTGSRNILDLNGTGKDGMNMLHNITGFANMYINNNVTFSEDITVTGTNTVTVEGTGVLNLRLKKETPVTSTLSGDTISKAIHAFSGRTGKYQMIIEGSSSDEVGTLNFITNGIGRMIDVDMENIRLENMKIKASSIIDKAEIYKDFIRLGAGSDLGEIVNPKEVKRYGQLNKVYRSIYSSREENLDGLRDILNITYLGKNYDYNNRTEEEQLANLLNYLNDIYTGTPYSYSSELSRRSAGMFRDIVTENEFRPNQDKWLIMGGFTHADGGTKDTYYGRNYHGFDTGTSDTKADMKLTGAYMLAKYGYSENTSLGLTLGGNKSEAEISMSKVKGNSGYLGVFAENYRGNLTLKAGAGVQYSEYDADRRTIGGNNYSDKYSDMTYDIYLNGRYSHNIGDNLFLEPYATLSYSYIDQDGANEGSKALAIETDSKSFDYTVGKVGVDLKKVIPHEKGKSTLSAGVSYTRILDGADEEHITGRFKGGSNFDILVAHKNEHSMGLNAKYALELENGVIFDVKGTYSVERDSHNQSGKNRTKGEWIVGAGVGYKF